MLVFPFCAREVKPSVMGRCAQEDLAGPGSGVGVGSQAQSQGDPVLGPPRPQDVRVMKYSRLSGTQGNHHAARWPVSS